MRFNAIINSLPEEWKKENKGTVNRWMAGWEELKRRAEIGAITMEDLADFGKEEGSMFHFDDLGDRQPFGTKTKYGGHIGKAAIIGIPWMAKIGTDRSSLSRTVDKLMKGRPTTSFLMKARLALFN